MNIAWWHRFSAPTGRRYHRDARHDPPRLPQSGPAPGRPARRPVTTAVRLGRATPSRDVRSRRVRRRQSACEEGFRLALWRVVWSVGACDLQVANLAGRIGVAKSLGREIGVAFASRSQRCVS